MGNSPVIFRTVQSMRRQVATWREAGERVALIPTMGALHEGHLDLVRLAQRKAKRTVVSIFVNPTQFAPNEDFSRYPRTEAADVAKLALIGCDAVWAPNAAEMYPDGFATHIVPTGVAEGLESDTRPHFFGGVATVCCKLFTQVTPDIAVFGEKDYQQLCVVQQMVRDLHLPLVIVSAPTTREADGLAMSSRNAYLSPEQRQQATAMYRAITNAATAVRAGMGPAQASATARAALAAAGFEKIDYVEVRDTSTLAPSTGGEGAALRVLAAAWLGKTRLIDNVAV
jgi:pantoate--beta-alanine ligase